MIEKYRDRLQIIFGNKQYELSQQDIKEARYAKALQKVVTEMSLDSIVVLNQRHVAEGFCVDDNFLQTKQSLYQHEGDFLITDKKRCGLVVLTADCLPIVLHDTKNNVIGIVHAGWRGSYRGVVSSALKAMQANYHSQLQDVDVLYGASAQSCCYEVQEQFFTNFESHKYAQKAFVKRENKLYFDNKQFITLQLLAIGIKLKNIYDRQAICTICSLQHCSFRREKDKAGRQVTVVSLL